LLQLRVIHQALQGLAGVFSALVCPVLHRISLAVVSEWYQEVMDYHSSNTPE
jgi:hypothetical protein